MQLRNLFIRREEYGADKGKLTGKVEFESEHGKVELQLDERVSREIVRVCADGIVRASQHVANELTADVIDDVPALEAPAE